MTLISSEFSMFLCFVCHLVDGVIGKASKDVTSETIIKKEDDKSNSKKS